MNDSTRTSIRTFWPIFLSVIGIIVVFVTLQVGVAATKELTNENKVKINVMDLKVQALALKQTEISTNVEWIKKYLENKQ